MQPPEQPPQQPPTPPAYTPAPTETAYPPAPAPAAPYYGQPVAPPAAPRRSRGPLIAIIAIALVVVIAGGGYLVGGFVYAQGLTDSATKTYNKVIDHENNLTDLFNKLTSQIGAVETKDATHASVSSAKTLYQQLVTQSQGAEPTITGDDQDLASADSKLKENSWLTALASSSLNKQSTKIGYLRSAVGVAKTITTDYVQYGNFNIAVLAVVDDLITLTDAADASDIAGATAAVTTMKADVAKAIPLDHAPGLPSDADSFMQNVKALADDFGNLLTAAAAGDQARAQQADNAVNADLDRMNAYDTSKFDTEAKTFYGNLIDQYNGFIDKANGVNA